MQVKKTNISDTQVVLVISEESEGLLPVKEHVLKEHFAKDVSIPGFRPGKAPLHIVEKNVDQVKFQNQFLEEVINDLFGKAIRQEKLRSVEQPTVKIVKFVPFTLLEFEATVAVISPVKLPDYKSLKIPKPTALPATDKEVDGVISRIQRQVAKHDDVDRAAKNGDQVIINFNGVDDKGVAVNGADGKEYPLILGSDAFIPGFETNLIGLKAGQKKTFTLKFPKEYVVKALANKDVTFSVEIIKVQEVIEPEVNDSFAASVGPFKTVSELRDDIKRQLTFEKANQADRDYETTVLKAITAKSKLTVPEVLINDEIEKRLKELNQNLVYRGQTMQDFLAQESKTEAEYIEKVLKPEVIERLKASIVLSEISELENVALTGEEVNARFEALKRQYRNPETQAELDKPEAKRDIANRILAEKTAAIITTYSSRSK